VDTAMAVDGDMAAVASATDVADMATVEAATVMAGADTPADVPDTAAQAGLDMAAHDPVTAAADPVDLRVVMQVVLVVVAMLAASAAAMRAEAAATVVAVTGKLRFTAEYKEGWASARPSFFWTIRS
jgi:hypothetical protein